MRRAWAGALAAAALAVIAGCGSSGSSTAQSTPAATASSPVGASSQFDVSGTTLRETWTLTCADQTELSSLGSLTLELNRESGIPTDIGFNGLPGSASGAHFTVPTKSKLPAIDVTYNTSGTSQHWVANGGAKGSKGTVSISRNGASGTLNVTFVPEQVSGNTAKGNLDVSGSWNCPTNG